MQNLELKAAYDNLDRAFEIAEAIGAKRQWTKQQIDTYFIVPSGKLKLRKVPEQPAELIAYQRPDERSAKLSNYYIYRSLDGASLEHVLSRALAVDLDVKKERTLYLWENVRLHFDRVQELGNFIEFEAVLKNSELKESREGLGFLQSQFEIQNEQLITVGYYELLKKQKKSSASST